MFGYNVVALRVERREGVHRDGVESLPLQVDNLDGRGLDLAAAWHAFFAAPRSEHLIRTRRFWQVTATGGHAASGPDAWLRLDVEYGASGIPGRVFDTAAGRPTASVRPRDATVHRYRHLLVRPVGGSSALLAAEVIGRGRAFKGPTDAFRKDFEAGHPDLRLTFDYLADGEFWDQFLAGASLVSATLTRQSPLPAYTSASSSGAGVEATMELKVKASARGMRLPAALIRPLLERRISPRDAFGVSFDPERLSLLLEAEGQRRQVYLDRGEPADLVYPIGDPRRRSQPPDAEFASAAGETLGRLLTRFRA